LWNIHGFYEVIVECIDNERLSEIPSWSQVEVVGEIVGPGRICIREIRVLHKPVNPPVENESIDPPEDPVEYTKHYYRYLKYPRILKSILVYSSVLNNLRSFLLKNGFIELPPPIIGKSSDPGLRGARKISIELYGGVYELQSSLIMYKQLYASLLDRVFYVARNIRLEPVENKDTGRHLVEFTQVDIEASDLSMNEVVKLGERALYYTIRRILNEYSELLDYSEIERLENEVDKPPYPRITYDEAVEILRKKGFDIRHGEELPFEAEARLAIEYNSPVWITNFPVKARGFYYLEDPARPGYNIDYNLILPGGHGEVLDGGCREYRYEKLREKIIEIHKEPLDKYEWFLGLTRNNEIKPTCGWGIGVERLVKYILNLKHIAYATPHPKIPGVIGP